ncbi:MAG: iron dependent repressor, metal binding and dimerization domain protein [Intrasporangium sp.]|uniref:metal-dependent transcriptional regulator n=1 Tax=Intrasporangium sp. TaxID=1925024 RepID=UPI003F7D32EC
MTDLIDTTEMYLRTIYELEEEGIVPLRARIAERLGHSGPTVSQTVGRMERDGLVRVTGDRHLELSAEGRLRAVRVMRKHRLAERLLVDVIGLEWEYAHDEACRWEHVMSEQVERKILGLIGEGRESPYGNPIPGLEELGVEGGGSFREGLVTLPEATAAASHDGARESPVVVTIRRIGEPVQVDPEALGLLTSAGVIPGAHVELRREAGRITVVRSGADPSAGVSLPDEIAAHVFSEPTA